MLSTCWHRVLRHRWQRLMEATDMKYIYYCERCGSMIQVEVDEETLPPAEVVCPKCEYPHAAKAFAAPQQSGCCGPAPRSGGGG